MMSKRKIPAAKDSGPTSMLKEIIALLLVRRAQYAMKNRVKVTIIMRKITANAEVN
jgi:hypothetical protein